MMRCRMLAEPDVVCPGDGSEVEGKGCDLVGHRGQMDILGVGSPPRPSGPRRSVHNAEIFNE